MPLKYHLNFEIKIFFINFYLFFSPVCCMTNSSLNSISSLQTEKSKISECGKKEFDSGIEEFSEFGEWSWHVCSHWS